MRACPLCPTVVFLKSFNVSGLAPLHERLIQHRFYAPFRLMEVDHPMAGQHEVHVDFGHAEEGLKVRLTVEIDGSAPAEVSGEQGSDDVAADQDSLPFMFESIGRAAAAVSGQMKDVDVDAGDFDGGSVFYDPIDLEVSKRLW